jgi:hypothetical protein
MMRPLSPRAFLFLVLPLLASASATGSMACGGRIILFTDLDGGLDPSSSSSSASSDDASAGNAPSSSSSGPSGSSSDTNFPVCPGVEPPAGLACPHVNQGCAYVDVSANTCSSMTCDADNHWVVSTPNGCP